MKRCSKCKKEKSLSKFYKNKNKKDGLDYWCKECKKDYRWNHREETNERCKKYRQEHREKAREYAQEYARKYPERIRKQWLKYKYGLTPKQHLQMYADQNGCCAICKRTVPYDRIFIDHNHKTGKVRGLLCQKCNAALGMINEKIRILKSMIRYIENE